MATNGKEFGVLSATYLLMPDYLLLKAMQQNERASRAGKGAACLSLERLQALKWS